MTTRASEKVVTENSIFAPSAKHRMGVCKKGHGADACKHLRYNPISGEWLCGKLFAYTDNKTNTIAKGDNCDASVIVANIKRFLRSSIGKKVSMKANGRKEEGELRGFRYDRKKRLIKWTVRLLQGDYRSPQINLANLKIIEKSKSTQFESLAQSSAVKIRN